MTKMKATPLKVIESDFLRGALISTLGACCVSPQKKHKKKIAKAAVQSGIALAAGMQFSRAWESRNYANAALYAGLGLLGVLAAQHLMGDENNGQEK